MHNAITVTGTSGLDGTREELEPITAWVFRELVSGELMPFVYLLKNDNPPRWKRAQIGEQRTTAAEAMDRILSDQ